jgi:hypothetical protein
MMINSQLLLITHEINRSIEPDETLMNSIKWSLIRKPWLLT